MTIRFESKCKNGTREERSRNEVLWQRMRLNPRRGSRSFFSLGCSRFFCCFRETARAVWAAGDEEGSRLEEAREQAKRGCCRLTNYTRSTRFTGDASSETIVHPRSFLYLFTLLFGRLCPPQKLDAAGSGSAACLHATVKRNERGRERERDCPREPGERTVDSIPRDEIGESRSGTRIRFPIECNRPPILAETSGRDALIGQLPRSTRA